MVHTFDSDIAAEYGVNAAILLQNLYFWIEKNRANNKHLHDGLYWTYNSVKAFAEMFPYMSPKQIRTAIDKLEEFGLILKGNYNKMNGDMTTWYAITQKAYALFQKGECIYPKGQMDFPEKANGFDPEGKAIPDINTDNKPDNITVSNDTVRQTDVQRCVDAWNALVVCGIKPISRLNRDSKRYKSLIARISQNGVDDVLKAIDEIKSSRFLQGNNNRGWMITFDWFVLPNNFPKVLEGNYSSKDKPEYNTQTAEDGWQ